MSFPFKLGKKPARPGSVSLKLSKYVNLSRLPTPPAEFGDERLVAPPWGMLGNADFGCCAWSGAAHETMVWTRTSGKQAAFTADNVLSDYGSTGFRKDDPATDQGTDMQQAASYRRKVGIIDAAGVRHKVGAYAAIEPGNLEMMIAACFCFEAFGFGMRFADIFEKQFDNGEPWDVVPNMRWDGGHYVSSMARRGGMFVQSTWGSLQPITDRAVAACNDENIAYIPEELLSLKKTLEGFDAEQLAYDLKAVSS